ncbi:MAG: plasmid replication initiator TrfA [Candidatus Competibacter sp.]
MNAETTRPADEEPPDAAAPADLPLFGPLGAALASLKKNIEKRSAEAPHEREEEKPEPLPLIDEEELAAIADPAQRERERRKKLDIYRQFPNALERAKQKSAELIAERNKVVVLTPWSDDKRAAPNAVFRSALFPALNNQTRKFIKEQKVYSVGGLDVTFTGEQFDQSDLDVYLEILNFAKAVPLGQPVRFSAYAMLKALGRCTGKSDHKWLHSVLIRLRGGTVELCHDKGRYFGGLIDGGIRDDITKHYDVTINPSYAVMFGFGLWSAIDLDQRRALERNSTAKALHAYYSTHAAPGLHRYETLAKIAGLEGKNRKAILIRAHEELKRVGFLVSYDAKPNGIEVVINMTEGQQQHVIKKITKTSKTP